MKFTPREKPKPKYKYTHRHTHIHMVYLEIKQWNVKMLYTPPFPFVDFKKDKNKNIHPFTCLTFSMQSELQLEN